TFKSYLRSSSHASTVFFCAATTSALPETFTCSMRRPFGAWISHRCHAPFDDAPSITTSQAGVPCQSTTLLVYVFTPVNTFLHGSFQSGIPNTSGVGPSLVSTSYRLAFMIKPASCTHLTPRN